MKNPQLQEFQRNHDLLNELVKVTTEKINLSVIGVSYFGGSICSIILPFLFGRDINDPELIAGMLSLFLLFFLIISVLVVKLQMRSENISLLIKQLIEKREKIINQDSSIGDIIDILENIQYLIDELKKYKNSILVRISNAILAGRINHWIYEYINKLKPTITMAHEDIYHFINEHSDVIKKAKSEVESTIKGNSELEQVSELQRARLDRQIEQFEELQKVLN